MNLRPSEAIVAKNAPGIEYIIILSNKPLDISSDFKVKSHLKIVEMKTEKIERYSKIKSPQVVCG